MAQQWEYAEIRRNADGGTSGRWQPIVPGSLPASEPTTKLAETLNALGADGWDFVATVDADLVLIRRPAKGKARLLNG